MLQPEESIAARRLNELREGHPWDATLQNLLGALTAKLEVCSRLPIYAYEAERAGHDACAATFGELAEQERRMFNDLLHCLRVHLDEHGMGDAR